jgi:RNA polymerase sigma-70 factor, ECF subfamily
MPGDAEYRPFALGVLRIEGGLVAETVSFHDVRLFELFGLPATLPA